MSKKDKSKFRKRIKTQILKEMAEIQGKPPVAPPVSSPTATGTPPPIPPQKKAAPTQASVLTAEPLNYIKKDLKKSAVIIALLIIVLVALVIADTKYDILLKLGNQIFRILHLNV